MSYFGTDYSPCRFPEDSIRLSLINPSAKPEYDCVEFVICSIRLSIIFMDREKSIPGVCISSQGELFCYYTNQKSQLYHSKAADNNSRNDPACILLPYI
ncbi:hypothetical protein ACET3Z_005286 [Daucus carota]